MTAVDKILNLSQQHSISLDKTKQGEFIVDLDYAWVTDDNGETLAGLYGIGKTLEEACENYWQQIVGKTLVWEDESGTEVIETIEVKESEKN